MKNPEILKLQFILKEKFNKEVILSGILDELTQNALKELKKDTTIKPEQLTDIFEKEYEIIEENKNINYKTNVYKENFLENKFVKFFYPKRHIIIGKTSITKINELKKQLKKTGCHFFIDSEENIYETFKPYLYIPFITQEQQELKQIEKISIFILINENVKYTSNKLKTLLNDLKLYFNIENQEIFLENKTQQI